MVEHLVVRHKFWPHRMRLHLNQDSISLIVCTMSYRQCKTGLKHMVSKIQRLLIGATCLSTDLETQMTVLVIIFEMFRLE